MGFRPAAPICQTKDWYDYTHDGTLRRRAASAPSTLGAVPPKTNVLGNPAVATGKCSFVNPVHRGTVLAPKQAFDQLRAESGGAKISPPQPKASHTWPDKSRSAALEQEVMIDGQKIQVTRPTDADAKGKNLPTTQQLAEALRAVPAQQRAFTKRVILSRSPATGSTSQQTIAGDAGSGEMTLYPLAEGQDQEDFDNRVMHESGHNYQEHLWSDGAQAVTAWSVAANADDRRPSPYAANNTGDDFCEFNILYNTAKDTPCEGIAKRIYPNRWAKRESY